MEIERIYNIKQSSNKGNANTQPTPKQDSTRTKMVPDTQKASQHNTKIGKHIQTTNLTEFTSSPDVDMPHTPHTRGNDSTPLQHAITKRNTTKTHGNNTELYHKEEPRGKHSTVKNLQRQQEMPPRHRVKTTEMYTKMGEQDKTVLDKAT